MDLAEVLSLWWVYPAALCIATLAISTGISGALFFVPFFLLVVGVSPAEAIGGGLMTMIFGTASGTFSYVRQGVVDFTIVKSLLLVTVPFAMAGALLAIMSDPDALRVLFGVMLFALAAFLVWSNLRRAREKAARPVPVEMQLSFHPDDTVIHAHDGREYRYIRPGRTVSQALGAAGALVQGFMGAGLPEATTTQLILRGPVPPRIAVGTSVTTLTVTVYSSRRSSTPSAASPHGTSSSGPAPARSPARSSAQDCRPSCPQTSQSESSRRLRGGRACW